MRNSFVQSQVVAILAIISAPSLIGLSQANAQGRVSTRQEFSQTTRNAREQLSLDIYNFVPATHGAGQDSNEGVSPALGDALLLQLAGQRRFQLRRVREAYSARLPAESNPATRNQKQQADSSGPTRYVLNATVGVFEPLNS